MPDKLTTPNTREKLASQIPAVELLMKLGSRYLPPTEPLQSRGGRKSEVLLTPILREQLTKLNRVRWRGREQAFPPDAIEGAIAALRDPPDEGHRTNFGSFHPLMRKVSPHACFIGFTGTPVVQDENRVTHIHRRITG